MWFCERGECWFCGFWVCVVLKFVEFLKFVCAYDTPLLYNCPPESAILSSVSPSSPSREALTNGLTLHGGVAHRLEQAAHNHLAVGSIPTTPTIDKYTTIDHNTCIMSVPAASELIEAPVYPLNGDEGIAPEKQNPLNSVMKRLSRHELFESLFGFCKRFMLDITDLLFGSVPDMLNGVVIRSVRRHRYKMYSL